MKILQAAQNVLIQRTVDIFTDMRDTAQTSDEYRDHFGSMGDLIHKIESYNSFGDICNALEQQKFDILGYCGDEEDIEDFLYSIKKYMEIINK